MSFVLGSRGGTRPSWLTVFVDETYTMAVSGSNEPPGQFVPPAAVAMASSARGPSIRLATGGVKIGPIRYRETSVVASARSSGVKSMRSSISRPCRS